MFVGLPEPPTKQSEQVNAKVRPTLEKGYEVPVIKNQQITIRHCRCIGGPLTAIEERHLAKDLPDSQGCEDELSPPNPRQAGFDPAANDSPHASPRGSLPADKFARLVNLRP